VGKTWLAKQVMAHYTNPLYLNYDNFDDRSVILEQSWRSKTDLLVFDELHKMKNWKQYIKGVFDKRGENQHILVTGSARLDTFRKAGEALTGRFFKHRLLPFSLKELNLVKSNIGISKLIESGGFPEVLIATFEDENRWRNSYIDGLIREDILDFENITKLRKIQILVELLKQRVGSPISYSSLARDLEISSITVKKYIEILEALFIIFRVTPHSKNIARSILKEPKVYFYDTGLVDGAGKKLENFIALSLLKHCYILCDQKGEHISLSYLRTKEGKEVDFCLVKNESLDRLIEVKTADLNISKSLIDFSNKYNVSAQQVVLDLGNKVARQKTNIEILSAEEFCNSLEL